MGHLDDDMMNAVNSAIAVSFGLGTETGATADTEGGETHGGTILA